MTNPKKHIPNNSRKGEARRGEASSTKSNKGATKQTTKPKQPSSKTNQSKKTTTGKRGYGGVPHTSRQPRKINSGLKAWNDARSYIAKENRALGRKFNRVELDALTKGFLLENYGKSWDHKDLDDFLKVEVTGFYGNPLDVDIRGLAATIYYMMDSHIVNYMPKGIDVVINAGELGVTEFNTATYNYETSGLQQIVETIRKETETLPPSEKYAQFDGFIKQKPNTQTNSKEPKDYYIEWVLFIDGGYVTEVRGTIAPKPATPENPIFEIKKSKKKFKKGSKKTVAPTPAPPIKKQVPVKTKATVKKKTIVKEKVQSFSAKELISIEKAKQKTMDYVLKLIQAGYTKAEINKLLNIK